MSWHPGLELPLWTMDLVFFFLFLFFFTALDVLKEKFDDRKRRQRWEKRTGEEVVESE